MALTASPGFGMEEVLGTHLLNERMHEQTSIVPDHLQGAWGKQGMSWLLDWGN